MNTSHYTAGKKNLLESCPKCPDVPKDVHRSFFHLHSSLVFTWSDFVQTYGMFCAVDNSSITLLTLTVCKSLNVHMHDNSDLRGMDLLRETVSGSGQNSRL